MTCDQQPIKHRQVDKGLIIKWSVKVSITYVSQSEGNWPVHGQCLTSPRETNQRMVNTWLAWGKLTRALIRFWSAQVHTAQQATINLPGWWMLAMLSGPSQIFFFFLKTYCVISHWQIIISHYVSLSSSPSSLCFHPLSPPLSILDHLHLVMPHPSSTYSWLLWSEIKAL